MCTRDKGVVDKKNAVQSRIYIVHCDWEMLWPSFSRPALAKQSLQVLHIHLDSKVHSAMDQFQLALLLLCIRKVGRIFGNKTIKSFLPEWHIWMPIISYPFWGHNFRSNYIMAVNLNPSEIVPPSTPMAFYKNHTATFCLISC